MQSRTVTIITVPTVNTTGTGKQLVLIAAYMEIKSILCFCCFMSGVYQFTLILSTLFTMRDLKICTWNATGIMSSALYMSTLLSRENIDLCGISEHWLKAHNITFMDSIHCNYANTTKNSENGTLATNKYSSKGGVSLLWHRRWDPYINVLDFNTDNIIGVQVQISKDHFLYVIQVYTPCSNHSIARYRDHLKILQDIISMYSQRGRLVLMGDFNSHLQGQSFIKASNARSCAVGALFNDNCMVAVNTLPLCTGAQSTFVSFDDRSQSMIDHIVVPYECVDLVSSCHILDDDCLNVSTHRPIIVTMQLCIEQIHPKETPFRPIKWNKVSNVQLQQCVELINRNVSSISVPLHHDTSSIDTLYTVIVRSLVNASDNAIPKTKINKHYKPYWDQSLKDQHARMKIKRQSWIAQGQPRDNSISYKEYKDAKRAFRRHHRHVVNAFLTKLNAELDRAACVDSNLFWKLFNKRRNSPRHGSEMTFDGKMIRDQSEITKAWGGYFSTLYSDVENPYYDKEFYVNITNTVNDLKKKPHQSVECDDISTQDIENCISELKCGKMCGLDGVYNEHLMYGKTFIVDILSKLFNLMFNMSYVPLDLKRGYIVTLYKGGNKRRSDPKSYRAITLSSCILKLYERVLLRMLQSEVNTVINPLQGGFQQGLGCNMTSYLVKECEYFCKENNSKLYACYFDTMTAFDRVWHSGLLYKLYSLGISHKLWLTVAAMHSDMYSCVLINGHMSDWFPVLQGTRQGGCWSPFLYLIYINDLISELQNSSYGLSIGHISVCAPTVADDMLLLSLSIKSLQNMIDICYNYSCRWRFQYNPSKCAVIVFNETKRSSLKAQRTFTIVSHVISEVHEYKHLGVIAQPSYSSGNRTDYFHSQLRKTFFGILNCASPDVGLSPVTCKHIYNHIVLPKALFGTECLFNLTHSEITNLERAHRLCIKTLQGMSLRTRTDIALSMIGSLPLQAEIDLRKLTLLGQLCRLKSTCTIKRLFLYRLFQYRHTPSIMGHSPDIVKILDVYLLRHYLETYLTTSEFPSKLQWKKIIKTAIWLKVKSDWYTRISVDEFSRFRSIHCQYGTSDIWFYSSSNIGYVNYCKTVAKLIAYTSRFNETCVKCNLPLSNICLTDHVLLDCYKFDLFRCRLSQRIQDVFGQPVLDCLYRLDRNTFVNTLIGVRCPALEILLCERYKAFFGCVFKYLHFAWLAYVSS